MAKGYSKISGVRLKIRTQQIGDDPTVWVTAVFWINDEPKLEVARIAESFCPDPSDPDYQRWLDAISKMAYRWLSSATGLEGLRPKFQAPDYKGEIREGD